MNNSAASGWHSNGRAAITLLLILVCSTATAWADEIFIRHSGDTQWTNGTPGLITIANPNDWGEFDGHMRTNAPPGTTVNIGRGVFLTRGVWDGGWGRFSTSGQSVDIGLERFLRVMRDSTHQSCSYFRLASRTLEMRSLRPAFSLAAMIVAHGVAAGQPGSIDPGFVNSLAGVKWISDLAFQPDGKIVFTGSYIGGGPSQARVGRVHPDGKADSTFTIGLGHAGSRADAVLLEPDGKILVGGYFTSFNQVPCRSIIRLAPDGSVDSTFNRTNGIDALVSDLIRDGDGRVLVVGYFTNKSRSVSTGLMRLNADATVDTTFAAPTFDWAQAKVVLQPDGKILIAGQFLEVGEKRLNHLARLNPDGSLDEAFAAGLSPYTRVDGLALQPDGRILVGGRFGSALVTRLHADGKLDPTFSSPLDVEDRGDLVSYGVNSFALQSGGKTIVSGGFRTINGSRSPYIARLNPDGTLDGNFDAGTGPDAIPIQLMLDPVGNLFVVGAFTQYNGVPANAWVRLLAGEPAPVAPVFRKQPVALVLEVGRTLKLASLVSAFPLPSYQWERDGVELPGATHSELVLTTNLLTGTYRLRASNSLGSAISEPVEPTVPSILTQPISETVRQGENVEFSVSATHLLPLSFQWQLEGVDVPGATNAALALTNVQPSQAGAYTVIVSNVLGIATSEAATLTVLPPTPPEILFQPRNQTVEVGMEVRFSVVATNYLPLTYQWQFNSADIVGATQANLTLPSVGLGDQGEYRVLVRSEYLTTQSDPALLVVKPVEFVPGPGVVTNTSQANLEAAMSSGLPVTFGVNGVIALTNTLLITKDTTLDATGRSITLDGQGSIRHFEVKPQATLRLINLRLVNGRHAGARGSFDEHGQPGLGGSIYNAGGAVELIGCELINNQALGGKGGQSTQASRGRPTDGGPAYGGAVYSVDGRVWSADCVFGQNRCVGGDGTLGLGISPVGGGGGDAHGGAIYVQGGALALTQVTLTDNVAEGGKEFQAKNNYSGGSGIGGAISVQETDAALAACVFVANEALGKTRLSTVPMSGSGSGGAIAKSQGTMTITGTHFMGNRALGGGGDSPGIETVFTGAGNGGAIFNESGVLEIRASALISNVAKGGDELGPIPWVSFAGDGYGGAIYNAGELSLINATLAENQTIGGEGSENNIAGSAYGGAIFNLEGSASLLNVTVASNSVQVGKNGQATTIWPPQALGGSIMVTNGTARLVNTILSCAPAQTNAWGTIMDEGHNLSSDASAQFTSDTSLSNADPLLAPLADNGGLTPTMALLAGSPAIDAADNSAAPPADQRGLGRPAGVHADIGAFEAAVPGPLAITTPPMDATVDTGQGVSFPVAVSAIPVTYQWQFNGADLPGATNAFLRLDNVQVAQAGEYRVIVSDASGSVTSPAATLTVVPPTAPVILVQPQSKTVRISDPVSLSVVATNLLWLTYQWQHDGSDIPGATDPTFEISAVTSDDAGTYTVVVSTPFLSTTSAPAVVTIDLRPFIVSHPADQQVIEGRSASLSVEADGDGPLAYQWFLDGIAFPGATNSTLTLENIPLTLAGTYTVTVRNSSGQITSQPASVSVRPSALDLDFVPSPDLGIWNVSALSVRAGGKVYVGGQASGFRVMSLKGDGSLDTTFTWPDFPPYGVWAVAFCPDESILAGGQFEVVSGVPRHYLARIDSDGSLNEEFVSGFPFTVKVMTCQPDGKALISNSTLPVVRLNADGTADTSFARPAIEYPIYEHFIVQADGRIVVLVSNHNNTGDLLVRCDAAGIRDRDFLVDFGQGRVLAIVPLPDGKLLAGGTFTSINDAAVFANLVRLNPDGSVDQTFNPNVPIPPVLSLAVERGGSVLVGVGAPEGVIRLSADGVLDRSFQVTTGPVYAIAVLNDETVLIGGSFQEVDGFPRLGVAKLRLPSSVPHLEGVIRIGPMLRLSMITPLGKTCILEHAESLIGAEWNPVQTVSGDGGRHVVVDTNAVGEQGFYWVRIE